MRAFHVSALALLGLALASPAPAAAGEMTFSLPIACSPGRDCWVQNHFDADPSPAVRDHECGRQSYDGHDGTDIRVRDTSVTADVLAAAAGTVKAVRDGESDRLVKSEADRATVVKRECGNGVVIAHEGGWETQYCHMKQGSLAVKPGQTVAAGEKLGSVGYSGMAAFAHIHLTIRKDGKALDPFAPDAARTCGARQKSLWTDETAAALAYKRGTLLRSGFAPGKVTLDDL
jgi:murein DD-endopeptidase MepM/ murein hydrolase activator NlpD